MIQYIIKEINIILWLVSLTLVGLLVFGMNPGLNQDKGYLSEFLTFILSTRSTAWALVLSFIIFSCTNSQGGEYYDILI